MGRRRPFAQGDIRRSLEQRDAFNRLYRKFATEDGLVPCNALALKVEADRYDITFVDEPDVRVYAVPESAGFVDYIVDHRALWNAAAFRATYTPIIFGSAPVFGVPFDSAVKHATEKGFAKAKYFLPETYSSGRYSTFLLHLRKVEDVRGTLLQLEAWQCVPGRSLVHYIHALSRDFSSEFLHFDGATIQYSESDLNSLFFGSEKVKGSVYSKHFRLDGCFSVTHLHRIARNFFPVESLYDEAFEVRVL